MPHSLKPIKKGGEGGDGIAAALKVAVNSEPPLNESDWPKPDHVAPFQPSPHESVIDRVQVAPISRLIGVGL